MMIYPINGDFEKGSLGWPLIGEGFQIIDDPDQSRTGSGVAVRSGAPESGLGTSLISCKEGDELVAQTFIRCVDNLGSGWIRITFQDGQNNDLLVLDGILINHTDYTPSAVRVKAPSGSKLFRLELMGSNPDGLIYYDDSTLELVNQTSEAPSGAFIPSLGNPQELGRSRVATQYTDSPRFLAWLNALLEPSLDIRNALFQVGDITDIDTAQGHNLDVIGDIVGIGRIVPQSIPLKFFGFEGQITADTFGEEGFLIYGSRFREELESAFASTVLADPEYRTLIKAKILKNHSHGTPEDIIKGLNFLLGVNDSMIEDFGGMEIGIVSGRQLTPVEVAMIDILDILPRPAAVKIRRRIMYIPGNYFGFQGQPNAQTWEEEDDPLHLGGIFSEEF